MAKLLKSNALGGYKKPNMYNSYITTLIERGIERPLCGYNFKLKKKKKTNRFSRLSKDYSFNLGLFKSDCNWKYSYL